MIKLSEISYADCEVEKRYQHDIDNSDTLEELKNALSYWKPLAEDAYKLIQEFDEKRFIKLQKAILLERKGKFSNNEDAMVILMPMPMFKVSQISINFKVPFGCALHRLMDEEVLYKEIK